MITTRAPDGANKYFSVTNGESLGYQVTKIKHESIYCFSLALASSALHPSIFYQDMFSFLLKVHFQLFHFQLPLCWCVWYSVVQSGWCNVSINFPFRYHFFFLNFYFLFHLNLQIYFYKKFSYLSLFLDVNFCN